MFGSDDADANADAADADANDGASVTDVDDAIAELEAAHDRLADVEAEIREVGEERVERVAAAYDRATDLLDRYRESAAGSGGETFQRFIEFQSQFVELVEGVDDDLPRAEAFETASDRVDGRRLSESDFDRAREALSPAGELADLLDRREAARAEYEDARRDAVRRLREVEDRVDSLERLTRLGDADFDAPVSDLRDPVERYDEAVRDDFEAYKREAAAREVLSFVASTAAYPLVEFRRPPEDLHAYLDRSEVGDEPIPTLLEYADYSRSKLDHYVADPDELKSRVATNRIYLERLDAGPLTVSWPPPAAGTLRRRADELVSVVGRFASEETVAALREVVSLARDEEEYERLRRTADAAAELTDDQRARLASGAVADELDSLRTARETLAAALDAYERDAAGE